MRIAVITRNNRKAGGVEHYLSSVIPKLSELGHSVSLLYEVAEPTDRDQIDLPDGAPSWCVTDLGAKRALAALRNWQPDLIYAHGLLASELEVETIRLAPSIFLAHGYFGTCISGAKTFKAPVVIQCHRRFGWQCLLHYFPHRCGGLSPFTMWHDFRFQSERLQLLRTYDAVITLSEHMKAEYLKHGIVAECAWAKPDSSLNITKHSVTDDALSDKTSIDYATTEFRRLLFVGRMDFLKGGHLFLEALPLVSSQLACPLRVKFAGDGPDRLKWEAQAARVYAECPDVQIEFTGWLEKSQLDSLMADCDLLVFPSILPEPFGLIGPEAGLHGLPVAAFAAGGTLDWLVDGVNGHLAPSDPPTAKGLAEAIIKCLFDPRIHLSMRRNALKVAKRFELDNHVVALSSVFDRVVQRRL